MAVTNDALECFLLHSRPYRETSLLLEFFSREQGRVAAIAKGVYHKKNGLKALLQLFSPLKIQVSGKSDLLTLLRVESSELPLGLMGQAQVCGFYLNELLMYSLVRSDPHPELFSSYQNCLKRLQVETSLAPILRGFELQLLASLGYGVNFGVDAKTQRPIEATQRYVYHAQLGFCKTTATQPAAMLFHGQHLHAMALGDFSDSHVVQAAKRLTRLALQPLLQGRVIHSRQLLQTTVAR